MARQNPYGSPAAALPPETRETEDQPPPDYYDRTSEERPSSGRKKASEDTTAPVFLPGTMEFDHALTRLSPTTQKTLYELLRAEFKLLKLLPEKDPGRTDDTPPPDTPPETPDEP